ncbi:MAG: glycosyltransferase, partial [Ilumatobacter sp.]|nr:glycosyltransferase [Ilumatobacter sp.]
MSTEPTLYEKLRWHAGRSKRWIKRRAYERSVGKAYRAWLAEGKSVAPGSVDNTVPLAVIVPVYNPPVRFLNECLNSVLRQSAKNWQLIVSDDGSTDPQVEQFLDDFAQDNDDDPRVIVIRGENGGISAAQNRALDLVATTHFGWLDHDDALDPRCFTEFSDRLAEHPEALIVYSDEDKFDAKGKHYEVYCKPDFSPELLLTQMYLCHFTVFE